MKQIQGLLLDRVVTILGLISNGVMKGEWKKDDDISSCHNCHSQFSFINRKQYGKRAGSDS